MRFLGRFLLASCAIVAVAGPLPAPAEEPADLVRQASAAAARDESEQAVKLLTQALGQKPDLPIAHYLRGREQFRLGRIKEAVADFDKYVQLRPEIESSQWERGIAYYYAGEFEKGAKQFELYQTYHDQDVENSTWRYLCVAATAGVEKARKNMLPIANDRRVPMMQIYDLYRGKLKPADVLAAVETGQPGPEEKNRRLFYAHLYLGLWHEAAGDQAAAREHLLLAEKHKIGHYMWDVAHIHAARLRSAKP